MARPCRRMLGKKREMTWNARYWDDQNPGGPTSRSIRSHGTIRVEELLEGEQGGGEGRSGWADSSALVLVGIICG